MNSILVLVLSLLLSASLAQAAATSRHNRDVTLPKRNEEEVLPDFVARPLESVYFQWEIVYDSSFNTFVVGTFNFSEPQWVAVGLNSNKRMNGPIVLCYANVLSGQVSCDDYIGTDHTLAKAEPSDPNFGRSVALAADIDDNGAGSIQFATLVEYNATSGDNTTHSPLLAQTRAAAGENYTLPATRDTLIIPNGFARTLFATGKWDVDAPKQHRSDERNTMLINFMTGKKMKVESHLHRITFYIMGGICVALIPIVLFERSKPRARSHLFRRGVAVVLISLYMACLISYIVLSFMDYKKKVIGKALWRSMGDGAAFCLSSLAIPVGKRLFYILSVSHERAIKYHTIAGILFLLLAVLHGGGMWYYYGTDSVIRWRNKDKLSHMPGPLTVVAAILVIIPALLRHFFWRYFRLLHYLYLVVFWLAVLHYPQVGIGLIPGALVHIGGFLARKFLRADDVDENLDGAMYDPESKLVSLDFIKSEVILPGQWFLITLPEISRFEQHPFSVAKMILVNDFKTISYRFVFRAENGWGKDVAEYIQKAQAEAAGEGACDPLKARSTVFKRFQLSGPYGVLQVHPAAYRHLVFIAGGIGITSHVYFLQQLLINEASATGETQFKLSVSLIWVAKEVSVLETFAHDLLTLKQSFSDAYPNLVVTMKIFCTEEVDGPVEGKYLGTTPVSKGVLKSLDASRGRPQWKTELAALAQSIGEKTAHLPIETGDVDKVMSPDAQSEARKLCAVYLCGPSSLMNEAQSGLPSSSGLTFHVHKEEFAF